MKKIYCIICGKYRKFEKPKVRYILKKKTVLSIICSKCENEDKKVYKEEVLSINWDIKNYRFN